MRKELFALLFVAACGSNKANADLFLSIHFNAVDPKDSQRVAGSETYILTPQFMTSTLGYSAVIFEACTGAGSARRSVLPPVQCATPNRSAISHNPPR